MQRKRKSDKRNPLWVLGAIGAFLLSQAKLILPLLKLGKFGGALISMFITIGAYAIAFPLPFAVGLVIMIFIHEMGHVFAAKRKGLPVTAPVFIPFLGALITMKKHPRDAVTEAYIAFGGPLLGTIGALAAYGLGWYMDSPLLLSIASIGFFLNLINLLPIHPLDGGRISTAVTRWLWLVGLIGGLVLIVYMKSILFFIIWAMFSWDLYKKFVKYKNREEILYATPKFELYAEPLLQRGLFIPGEEHRRELDFTTYSDIQGPNEGVQTVEVYWDSIDFKGSIQLPKQVIVRKVQVMKVEHMTKDNGLYLGIQIQIEYTVFENDRYYEVPAATRWKYGIAYVALGLFLFYMITQVTRLDAFS
jgi:Zn-dependent protease